MNFFTTTTNTQPPWLLLLTSLGFISLLHHFIIPLLTYLYHNSTFFISPKSLKTKYGSWAVVTGPTDGIGRAFAVELARQGMNLVLVGRNPDRLKRVSGLILSEVAVLNPAIEIRTLVVDFATAQNVEEVVREGIRGLDVGVLINNVGITYPGARYFHEVEEKVWMEIVKVNLEGTTMVTRGVIGGMMKRKKGAIVNVGSGAAIVVPSHPLYTIYAATKAYIDQLSRSLNVEYKHFGIDVQCQVPLYVATKMTRKVAMIEKSSLFIPTPKEYAEAAVHQIGSRARCTPYWAHSLQWYFARFLPESLLDSWRLSIGTRRMKL
ncbi:Very-long-chain 3-oxoacyl-CoA reductase-like protein At1g24470 [Linum grandiflorum]